MNPSIPTVQAASSTSNSRVVYKFNFIMITGKWRPHLFKTKGRGEEGEKGEHYFQPSIYVNNFLSTDFIQSFLVLLWFDSSLNYFIFKQFWNQDYQIWKTQDSI